MRHTIFHIPIDDLNATARKATLASWLTGSGSHIIVTPNAEMLVEANQSRHFQKLLQGADLAIADSVSLQYANAALNHTRIHNRMPGVDLVQELCALASTHQKRILLLGGETNAAEQAADVLNARFQHLDIHAIDPGRISWQDGHLQIPSELIQEIKDLGPACVMVALGHHKQEQFCMQAEHVLPDVNIWVGVGGAFEMISGQKVRAPKWASQMGLEWAWRLFIEPTRWRRIVTATLVFPWHVIRQSCKQKTFLRSCRHVAAELIHQFSL